MSETGVVIFVVIFVIGFIFYACLVSWLHARALERAEHRSQLRWDRGVSLLVSRRDVTRYVGVDPQTQRLADEMNEQGITPNEHVEPSD